MQGPAIIFERVGLTLSGVEILRDVSFSVGSGEIHCVIGPNGGGKTSLIRCLLGQMPHSGTISVQWTDGKTTGYVPQILDFDKTLPVTVGDFMTMISAPYRPAFLGTKASARVTIESALARVGLGGKRRSKLGSLSGGERQRVLFAQALIPTPALLVLDEPMTSMDEVGAEIFVRLIRELSDAGATIVWIAHDLEQVAVMAGTVTCINRTVLFSGPPAQELAGREAQALFAHAGALR
ncbi:MAG TPA: metal ABC transporter ATP-binding protein [Gammaproteobacteria bacterium]